MQRSTFQSPFLCEKGKLRNRVRFPLWAVSPSTARCRSSAANSPFVLLSGMPKRTRRQVRASNRSASTRSWKISRPISAKQYQRLCDRDSYVTAERFATPSSVWVTTAACCCRLLTNTSQAFQTCGQRPRLFHLRGITVCVAGVSPLSSNTNTTSRTFLSKS